MGYHVCRLSMEFDSDDSKEDEVIFQFMADQLLGTDGEVCNNVTVY